MKENEDLGKNLCTAAHLIHGSSEGRLVGCADYNPKYNHRPNEDRFKVLWGAGRMTKEEIEGVGFEFCDCAQMMQVDIVSR